MTSIGGSNGTVRTTQQAYRLLYPFDWTSLRIVKWNLGHSMLIFLALWYLSAVLILAFEEKTDRVDRAEFERSVAHRRFKFVEALRWLHLNINVDSAEWRQSVMQLLEWHGEEHKHQYSRTKPSGHLFLLMTTCGGEMRFRLSSTAQILIILWTPPAVLLYYTCVWRVSKWIYVLRYQLQLLVVLLFFISFTSYSFIYVSSEFNSIIQHLFHWTMFLLNIRLVNEIQTNTLLLIVFHLSFWTIVMTGIRHFNQWKQQTRNHWATLVEHDRELALNSRSSIYKFREEKFTNRLYSIFCDAPVSV